MDHRLYKNNQASALILHGLKTDGPLFFQLFAWNQNYFIGCRVKFLVSKRQVHWSEKVNRDEKLHET